MNDNYWRWLVALVSLVLITLAALYLFLPKTSHMRCQTAQISEHMSETRCIRE